MQSRLLLAVLAALCVVTTTRADIPGLSALQQSYLDTSVSPCDDFYQYACGGWIAKEVLPPSQPIFELAISSISERNDKILREIITKGDFAKVAPYYAECMDVATIDKLGSQPAQAMLKALASGVYDIPGGGVNPGWVMKKVAAAQLAGVPSLFNVGVTVDGKDPSQYLVEIDQGGFTLSDRSFYADHHSPTSVIPAYEEHIKKMFVLAGVDLKNAVKYATMVVEIESTLAAIALPSDDTRNPVETYHNYTLAGLQKLAPHVFVGDKDADSVLLSALSPDTKLTRFVVSEPSVLKAVNKLVEGISPVTWVVYLQWQYLHSVSSLLSADFRDETFNFFGKVLTGAKVAPGRAAECRGAVEGMFPDIIAKHYVAKAFGGEAMATVSEMVSEIENAFGANVKKLKWMDAVTKKAALKKLSMVTKRVGYPKVFQDYAITKVLPGKYFATTAAATDAAVAEQFTTFNKPVDRSKWEMAAFIVNAYYEPTSNSINFPAGILQPPYFNATADPAARFGGIGLVMGHELSHGFDDQGRLYDGTGKLTDWWAKSTAAQFKARTQCLAKQYSKFEVAKGVFVNGNLTLGENIADNGGMKTTTSAYTLFQLKKLQEPNLRLLWISYAQTWCAKADVKYEKLAVLTDVHSPPKFRVNGPLMNLPAFAAEFKCPVGSHMNPKDRCEIW